MIRIQVKSEAINNIGYDESKQTLEVEFKHGNIYQYYRVSKNIYDELMVAKSIGDYCNNKIRPIYPYSRVE